MDENRSIFLIRQLPNIVKSMSISLYFVRTYFSESWIWSHFQNNTIVCSFSRKLRKKMFCCKITSVCLSFAAKCWRCFTNALMTLRHYAFSRQHRTQFSEDVSVTLPSMCKFGALKSYLFLVLSRVPLSEDAILFSKNQHRPRCICIWFPSFHIVRQVNKLQTCKLTVIYLNTFLCL